MPTNTTFSQATLDHLVELLAQARPEWDSGLVRVVLHSHRFQVDGTDLAIAALRAARNPDLLTPKAIGWRGRHWDGLSTRPADIVTHTRCGVCGKLEPQCVTQRFGDDDHQHEPTDLTRREVTR